jgi:lysozyme
MNLGTLLDDIERDEGYRQFPYEDTAKPPRLTIGFGFNLTDVGLSREECQLLAAHRLRKIDQHLIQALAWYTGLNERRRNALVNMAYQMGVQKLLTFRDMHAALDAGDFDKAAAEALDSTYARQVPERAKRIATAIKEG